MPTRLDESLEWLEPDGLGRATARSLALAIGADPNAAAALLGERRAVRAARGAVLLRGFA
jgi:hypothetical protein